MSRHMGTFRHVKLVGQVKLMNLAEYLNIVKPMNLEKLLSPKKLVTCVKPLTQEATEPSESETSEHIRLMDSVHWTQLTRKHIQLEKLANGGPTDRADKKKCAEESLFIQVQEVIERIKLG